MLRRLFHVCLVIAWLGVTQQAARAQMGMPPMANDDWALTLTYWESVVIAVLDNDAGNEAELDPGSVVITAPPMFGSVSVDGLTGEVTYTPDGNPAGGYDAFEYTVADELGQVSNAAWVEVSVEPNHNPMLSVFYASPGTAGVWHFEGTVEDEDLDATTIQFGGILEGESCGVLPDGTFRFSKLIEGSGGLVTAKAIDPHGLESNEEWDNVGY